MLDFGYDESRDQTLEPEKIPEVSVRTLEVSETHGVFSVEPLPRGYGMTLGNPLRRVLLSSIEGSAVNWVRIEGIEHEYSTLPYVKEDVVDILLNVKSIHLRSTSNRPGKLRLEVEGPGEIVAGDIMTSSDFEIVNPEQAIATLDGTSGKLVMEMNVEQGVGYEPASSASGLPIGVLPVDAIFTPVRKVNFNVERTRVGQHTDFERLVLDVWTNGAISPADAVRQAARGLVDHFFKFAGLTETDAQAAGRLGYYEHGRSGYHEQGLPAAKYNLPVESLNLTARTLNCLKRASIHKVGEILERSRAEFLRIRNFGEKSLEELDQRLRDIDIIHLDFQVVDETAAQSPEAGDASGESVAEGDEASGDDDDGDDKEKEE